MSAASFVHTGIRRGGLLGFVTGAHALLLVMLTLVRLPVPPVNDKVMMVEMLPMTPAAQKSAVPQPVRPAAPPEPKRPRLVRPKPIPKPVPTVKAPPLVPVPVAETAPAAPGSSAQAAPVNEPPAASDGGGATGGSASPSPGAPASNAARGGGESRARFDADYLKNPAPPYPRMSRKMREEGKVFLRVLVTPEGTAGSVDVKTSSGSRRLDDSALRTVRLWKFIPARRGDAPIQSWVLVPIIFKLEQ